ncbi:venom carboxylesterase-6-like [Homarus americanus]|uniref:venom carboxylesterase-6-like n=1 Tax=Homarus americanus TaxID=6706 RepID=UPI001C4503DE|nr:venom carboxylesterase-6-like [Homarus americanus]
MTQYLIAIVGVLLVTVKAYGSAQPPEATVEVQLKQGNIIGFREEAGEGRYFYSFKSIPYAQPPVGDLRFKDPIPAGGWTEPRNGSLPLPACPQSLGLGLGNEENVTGSEDCLYLTVYTPSPHASGLPVMVWFHGGGFNSGSGELYTPFPLLTRDIVLVIVQYRLGTLGFLSTEDLVLPGNLGLKDQTLALRWVQDNVQDLGGDPTTVTIFGESSGGGSAHLQMLTPYARGLFNRAILQSGSALSPWAVSEGHRQVAIKVGNIFNCSDSSPSSTALDSTQLLACLQRIPFEKLVPVANTFRVWYVQPLVMTPRVDGDYLPDHPATLIKTGRFNKVDLISGHTQHEGAMFAALIKTGLKKEAEKLEREFTTAGPASLYYGAWEESPVYMARRAYYHYLGETKLSGEKIEEINQMITDGIVRVPQEESAQLHTTWSKPHSVFKYELQHRAQYSISDLANATTAIPKHWVSHGDDLLYIFNITINNITMSLGRPADLFLRDVMLTLWTNFAATGNPTPDGSLGFRWWPTTQSRQWYLALTTSPTMRDDLPDKALEFWKNMPTKRNKLLYPERFTKNETSGSLTCTNM